MKKIFLSIVSIIAITFVWSAFSVFWQNTTTMIDTNVTSFLFSETVDGESLIDVLIVDQELTKRRRWIILHYCDSILKKKAVVDPDDKDLKEYWFDIDTYKYDPRQSLFIYALCVNIDEESKWREISWEEHIYRNYKEVYEEVEYSESWVPVKLDVTKMRKDDIKLNELREIPEQVSLNAESAYSSCDPVKTMQSCNISSIAPVIFKNIMNEYSNIKLAAIYWYKTEWDSDSEKLDEAVKKFANNYFGDPQDPNAPCWEEWMTYLHKDDSTWKAKHCNHPETHKELEETIKSAQRLIEKLKYLDHEKIMDPFDDPEKSNNLAEYCNDDEEKWTSPKHLLHACWFTNRWDISFKSDRQTFYNLYANELMWYNLFVDYYANRITSSTAYSPLRLWSISATYRRNQKEVNNLWYEKWIAQQATFQSLRMLTNVYTTFPSYIALKAYQEDLLNYRETLAKTYTPVHQLYYTTRNVQECQDGQ